MTTETQDLIDEMDRCRALKESCDWEDLMPMLMCIDAEGSGTLVGLAVPRDEALQVIPNAIAMLNPVKAILVCDAYATTQEMTEAEKADPTAIPVFQGAPLSERWAAGDRENITEALQITVYDGTEMISATLGYDAEAKTWHEPKMSTTGTLGGAYPDALRLGFAAAEEIHGPR